MGALTLVLVLVLIVGLLASRFNSPSCKGKRGEAIVADRLRNGLPDEYHILDDVYLPLPDGTTAQVDHIVISRYGIFVVETKNYPGWIFASEKSQNWKQTIYRFNTSFKNPIHQNYAHIRALSDNLKMPRSSFTSVVAFTGDCEFKTDMPFGVMYSRDAARFIRSFSQQKINPDDVGKITDSILACQASVSDERKSSHVSNLAKRHCAVSEQAPSPKCPFCGGEMVIRNRKSDGATFYGCRRFPRCRGIVNIAH